MLRSELKKLNKSGGPCIVKSKLKKCQHFEHVWGMEREGLGFGMITGPRMLSEGACTRDGPM